MTEKERKEVEKLLENFYKFLDIVKKQEPYNQTAVDRILDDINLCRKLLEL